MDVSSFGKNYEEALTNVKEPIELYLEDADLKNIQEVEMPAITITQIDK